jgi:hypothetical protein
VSCVGGGYCSHPPRVNDRLGLGERSELMPVQTLVTQPPIERLNKRIFHGFAGSNEVELDAALT